MWKKIHFKKFAAGGLASRQWSLKKIQRLGLSCWRAPYTDCLCLGCHPSPASRKFWLLIRIVVTASSWWKMCGPSLPGIQIIISPFWSILSDEPLSFVSSQSIQCVSFHFLSCFLVPSFFLYLNEQRFDVLVYVLISGFYLLLVSDGVDHLIWWCRPASLSIGGWGTPSLGRPNAFSYVCYYVLWIRMM